MSDPIESAITAEHSKQERAWVAFCIAHDQAMENGQRMLAAEEMLAKCSARFEHIRRRLIAGFEGDPLGRLGLADYAVQCIAEIAALAAATSGGDAKQTPCAASQSGGSASERNAQPSPQPSGDSSNE
jgi:hypothetical protein